MYELIDIVGCHVDCWGVCVVSVDVFVERLDRQVSVRLHAYDDGERLQEIVLFGCLPDEWRGEVTAYLESHEKLQELIRREFSKILDREVA